MALLPANEFLNTPGTTFDVRSPGEFAQGHIPGAFNLPLFSDSERAAVGTAYKQQGQKEAISLGLTLTGPKLADLVSQATAFTNKATMPAKVYCWRGGMRSGALSWLLEFAGIKTTTMKGGYKAFRHWVLEQFDIPRQFIVLGGMTGSGKTALLNKLSTQGHQAIDLEDIANHRGSTYGKLGMSNAQPSSEHFENEMAVKLAAMDPFHPIWIEDESRMIGSCHLPNAIFNQLHSSPMIFIDIPREERIQRLIEEYGKFPIEHLMHATERIGKQLGGQRKKEALTFLEQGQLSQALAIVLEYYDRAYTYSLSKRQHPVTKVHSHCIEEIVSLKSDLRSMKLQ